jgi:pyruvate/2-oxoglutarate/acetoin dehydrogenase E1 component
VRKLATADRMLGEGKDVDSVRKTTRLVIAHEAVGSGGVGAEIAARVSDSAVWSLDAPIRRFAPPFTPAPYSPSLEAQWLPTAADILCCDRARVRGSLIRSLRPMNWLTHPLLRL